MFGYRVEAKVKGNLSYIVASTFEIALEHSRSLQDQYTLIALSEQRGDYCVEYINKRQVGNMTISDPLHMTRKSLAYISLTDDVPSPTLMSIKQYKFIPGILPEKVSTLLLALRSAYDTDTMPHVLSATEIQNDHRLQWLQKLA